MTLLPNQRLRYELPPNVCSMAEIPLWGANAIDAIRPKTAVTTLIHQKSVTLEVVIKRAFVPSFCTWLASLFEDPQSPDWQGLGQATLRMARFLRDYDYDRTFRSTAVWQAYEGAVANWYRSVSDETSSPPAPSKTEIVTTLGWLAAMLRPLGFVPPVVDLFHTTIASPVSLVGIVARLGQGIPLLLTEHGVYLRERAISALDDPTLSFFEKYLLVRIADVCTRLCYHVADVIAPVCKFNGVWGERLGASPEKIQVIYNAVDSQRFLALDPAEPEAKWPTVVAVANIIPLRTSSP